MRPPGARRPAAAGRLPWEAMPPSAELPGFLAGVAPILDRWGYLAIAGIIGVESFGVPAPGQTIMVAASVYAGAGRMNIFAVAAVSFVAAVLGDNVGYWIGVRGGRKAVHRFGRYVFLTPERFARAEKFFARRGNRVVLVARFIDGLRQLNGVIGYQPASGTSPRTKGTDMLILGLILLLLGIFLKISILYTIGIILLVVGAVLWILGAVGRPIGGRKVWF